ncbi:MAG: CHASE2 domain-containing protein, partial [Granulosicoccus sp.]|nr:CHASE2 domain-containing protein [Granulosicoccus sp.]
KAKLIKADELPANIINSDQTRNLITTLRSAFHKSPTSHQMYLNEIEAADHQFTESEKRILRSLGTALSGNETKYLNLYGPPGTVKTIPYHELLTGKDASFIGLKDSIVLVGSSSVLPSSQHDGFPTAYTSRDGLDLSGVEIAATTLGNLLADNAINKLGSGSNAAILIGFGILTWTLAMSIPGTWGVASILCAGACYFLISLGVFTKLHVWLPLFIPLLLQLPVALVAGQIRHYKRARQTRETAIEALGLYVPRQVAHRISHGSVQQSPQSDVIRAVCFCSDIQGYTSLSEKVKPDRLTLLTNEYFDQLGSCIRKHGGEIMNYFGDAATCIWEAPEPSADVRLRASLASLEVLNQVKQFNQRHQPECFPTRIGLHIGDVAIGDTGGGGHFNYGITGDAINTTSRIEQLSKKLGTCLLATEDVIAGIDSLLTRRTGDFVFKGKTEILTIHEIIARQSDATANQYVLCDRFSEAIQEFEAERWSAASTLFDELLNDFPDDGPSLFFRGLCGEYLQIPEHQRPGSIVRLQSK